MQGIAASRWLLILSFLLFLEVRLLGGRTTVGFSRLLLGFSFGATGAAIINIAVQRIALVELENLVVAWTVGPALEEFAKAIPVLLLVYGFSGRRRLTVADYTLIGLASGLGFYFVEKNFRAVVGGGVPPLRLWMPDALVACTS
jgi:RsiW-degrading membrane proteinase PrsW (M82 family)